MVKISVKTTSTLQAARGNFFNHGPMFHLVMLCCDDPIQHGQLGCGKETRPFGSRCSYKLISNEILGRFFR